MGWVTDLSGQVVGLDTAPLIYFIEENPVYFETVQDFFRAIDARELTVVTSTVTLLEVLVHPLRRNDIELAAQYREILLHSQGLTTIPLSATVAEEAAQLRAEHSIRTPDAIQMAAAIGAGATAFLTNDAGVPSLPDIDILLLDELIAASP